MIMSSLEEPSVNTVARLEAESRELNLDINLESLPTIS